MWTAVPGYEGLYSVSDEGEVRSEARIVMRQRRRAYPSQLLAQRLSSGYPTVNLVDADGKRTTWRVHVLMLMAFVGPRPPGHEGCHEDDVKTHNVLSNLYWGTRFQNKRDEVRNGKHANASKTHCKRNHEFTDANTIWIGRRRNCRTCRTDRRAV